LSADYVHKQENRFPTTIGPRSDLNLTFSPEDLQKLVPGRQVADPLTMTIKLDAFRLVQGLAKPMAEVTQPWSIKTLSAQEPFVMYFKAALWSGRHPRQPMGLFARSTRSSRSAWYAHERPVRPNDGCRSAWDSFIAGVLFCYFCQCWPLMLRFPHRRQRLDGPAAGHSAQ